MTHAFVDCHALQFTLQHMIGKNILAEARPYSPLFTLEAQPSPHTAQGILKHDILASVPYPFSIGGAVHFLFFAAEDPHNPDHFVRQMMR